jgi:molybdate transport system ATP-binding protein
LTGLTFDGGAFAVPQTVPAGGRVRLVIAMHDIMIARDEPRYISANNVLHAIVMGVKISGALADVELTAGTARLVARITAASAQRLALAPGVPVFAIVKSVAVDREQN